MQGLIPPLWQPPYILFHLISLFSPSVGISFYIHTFFLYIKAGSLLGLVLGPYFLCPKENPVLLVEDVCRLQYIWPCKKGITVCDANQPIQIPFAYTRLNQSLCWLVEPSVCWSVRLLVILSCRAKTH